MTVSSLSQTTSLQKQTHVDFEQVFWYKQEK